MRSGKAKGKSAFYAGLVPLPVLRSSSPTMSVSQNKWTKGRPMEGRTGLQTVLGGRRIPSHPSKATTTTGIHGRPESRLPLGYNRRRHRRCCTQLGSKAGGKSADGMRRRQKGGRNHVRGSCWLLLLLLLLLLPPLTSDADMFGSIEEGSLGCEMEGQVLLCSCKMQGQ